MKEGGSAPDRNGEQVVSLETRRGEMSRHRRMERLWRPLALLQLPITFVAVFCFLIFYLFADTVMVIPEKPDSAVSVFENVPDAEFANTAIQFVNLTATYQPHTVRDQYEAAGQMLTEPLLSKFQQEIKDSEVKTAEEGQRSQLFQLEGAQIQTERDDDAQTIEVRLPGILRQFISFRPLPPQEVVYYIELTRDPERGFGPYRTAIKGLRTRAVPLRVIAEEDKRRAQEPEEKGAKKKRKKRGVVQSGDAGRRR